MGKSASNGLTQIDHGGRTDAFLAIDEAGNINPRTPEVALVAAHAYLLTTRPAPGDPRADMHNASTWTRVSWKQVTSQGRWTSTEQITVSL
jgi:hypothetical protein